MTSASVRRTKKLKVDSVTVTTFFGISVFPNLILSLNIAHVIRGGKILMNVTTSTVIANNPVVLGGKKITSQCTFQRIL
jgi:hypothetical protein